MAEMTPLSNLSDGEKDLNDTRHPRRVSLIARTLGFRWSAVPDCRRANKLHGVIQAVTIPGTGSNF